MNDFIQEIKTKKQFRESIIDSLCKGVKESSLLRDMLDYVVDEKLNLFDNSEFSNSLYEDEDVVVALILPSVRRVFSKVFIDYPTLFKSQEHHLLTTYANKRLELYQLNFDIDEFIDYLIEMFRKTKNCLESFTFLDRTAENLTLIVDNYIAMLVKKVTQSDNIDRDIRDLKLKKLAK